MYIAVGMFISSLTESQIISAVGTFAACFFLIMWNSLVSFIPATKASSIIGFILIILLLAVIVQALYGNVIITAAISVISLICVAAVLITHSDSMSDIFVNTLSALDFTEPLYNAAYYYIFDIGGAVFYISVIALFIVLTVQVLNKRRWS
jgi:ABC-2 type transport system permease protein